MFPLNSSSKNSLACLQLEGPLRLGTQCTHEKGDDTMVISRTVMQLLDLGVRPVVLAGNTRPWPRPMSTIATQTKVSGSVGLTPSAIHNSKSAIWFTHTAMPPSDRPSLPGGQGSSRLPGLPGQQQRHCNQRQRIGGFDSPNSVLEELRERDARGYTDADSHTEPAQPRHHHHRRTSVASAPSAIRMPISCVRCETA